MIMCRMNDVIYTRCCIAGGGPAGVMLGFLLARMGIDVFVLEKHADFLRDFRGDTIHPSTLEIMHELGILDEFLKRPHQEIRELAGQVGQDTVTIADFTHLPTHCRFLAFMPQWDFLDFITEQARRYSTFHLKMQAGVTDLIEEKGGVAGVHVKTPDGPLQIRAQLTIGADGRHSVVRERAGLEVIHLGAPMDVMWMRISRRPTDPGQTFGHIEQTRPNTAAENSVRKRASCRPATEEFPDSGHAATSNPGTEQRYPAGPWQPETVDPSVASEAAPALANSAADSCARNRGRVSSRARENSRSSHFGQQGIKPCSFLNHRQDAFGAERRARSFRCLSFQRSPARSSN